MSGDEVTLELASGAGRGSGWNQGLALASLMYPLMATAIAIAMPFLAAGAGATVAEGIVGTAVFAAIAVGAWWLGAPTRRAFFGPQPSMRIRRDAVVFEMPALLAVPFGVPLARVGAFARLDRADLGLPVFGSGSVRKGAPNFAVVFNAPQPVPAVGRQRWGGIAYFGYRSGRTLKGGELINGVAVPLEQPALGERALTDAGVPEMSQADLLAIAPPRSDAPWTTFVVATGFVLLLLAALVLSSQAG